MYVHHCRAATVGSLGWSRLAAVLLALSFFTACAPLGRDRPPSSPTELQNTEVVAVTQPGFRLPVGTALAWAGEPSFYVDQTVLQADQLSQDLRRGLELALGERGYRVVTGEAAFIVFATVILGDAGVDEPVMGVLRQHGAAAAPTGASLGMALRRPAGERNVWQAVVRFDPGDPGQPQQFLSRLMTAAEVLLQRLPGQ